MTDVILVVAVTGGALGCLLCVVILLLGAILRRSRRSSPNGAGREKSAQAKSPEDAMEKGVPMQSPQPTPDTTDVMGDREAKLDAHEKGQDGALPVAAQLPAPANLPATLAARASFMEDTLPAGAIMLTDERQLYVDPEGWAAVAPEGAASNTDAARRMWAMDETSGVLSLPDGRQLYVNRDGRAGVAPEGANTNTDTARRCLRFAAGIFSLADGRQLYVKKHSDVGADAKGAAENTEEGRRTWASTAALQVSPDAALRAAMSAKPLEAAALRSALAVHKGSGSLAKEAVALLEQLEAAALSSDPSPPAHPADPSPLAEAADEAADAAPSPRSDPSKLPVHVPSLHALPPAQAADTAPPLGGKVTEGTAAMPTSTQEPEPQSFLGGWFSARGAALTLLPAQAADTAPPLGGKGGPQTFRINNAPDGDRSRDKYLQVQPDGNAVFGCPPSSESADAETIFVIEPYNMVGGKPTYLISHTAGSRHPNKYLQIGQGGNLTLGGPMDAKHRDDGNSHFVIEKYDQLIDGKVAYVLYNLDGSQAPDKYLHVKSGGRAMIYDKMDDTSYRKINRHFVLEPYTGVPPLAKAADPASPAKAAAPASPAKAADPKIPAKAADPASPAKAADSKAADPKAPAKAADSKAADPASPSKAADSKAADPKAPAKAADSKAADSKAADPKAPAKAAASKFVPANHKHLVFITLEASTGSRDLFYSAAGSGQVCMNKRGDCRVVGALTHGEGGDLACQGAW
eukprot:CAMPEP_0174755612 /NCGR_PEP_ID=MMETSP1094-20130205/106327_1 /TAXON_ID=156173 /ORGANISM="Chrysochromulina brevifilum, Strain UTEX LB 985" /LENGTH=745 /DNA_ID=CAMNT_0015961501 /DNA_START=60 /DNA_END=2296 /DNA_ORIENTATION=-